MHWPKDKDSSCFSFDKFLVVLIAAALVGSVTYSVITSSASSLVPNGYTSLDSIGVNCNPNAIASSSGSNTTTCTATVTGNSPTGTIDWSSSSATGVFGGTNYLYMGTVDNYDPVTTSSVLATVKSQGLQWVRTEIDTLAGGTQSEIQTFVTGRDSAGISVLGLFNLTPETSCGSGTLQSESSYKSKVASILGDFPNIHTWEYGNEVISPCPSGGSGWGNISPANYFQGLVWFDECLIGDGCSISGHSSDIVMGPALTIYSASDGLTWDGYGTCSTVANCKSWNGQDNDGASWFYSLWHESLSDSFGKFTPSTILNYISLHVYTDLAKSHTTDGSILFSSVMASGPFQGQTLGTILMTALDLYNQISSEEIIVTEFGSYTEAYNSHSTAQFVSSFLGDAMTYFDTAPYLKGLFYYELVADNSGSNNGLWNYASPPTPLASWYTWAAYLSDNDYTSTPATWSTCALLNGSCLVTYYDPNAGTPTITGSYSGDSNNQISSGSFQLTVTGSITSTTSTSTSTLSSSTTSISSSSTLYSSTSSTSSTTFSSASSSTQSSSSSSSTSFSSSIASSSSLPSSSVHSYSQSISTPSTGYSKSSSSFTSLSESQGGLQSNPVGEILSVLSPSKDPPFAYGLGTYEIFMIGTLICAFLKFRQSDNLVWDRYDGWRW